MEKIVIVGSGASAAHFALSVLKKGYEVVMLDVGRARPPAVNPDDTLNGLKNNLNDPVSYFLGERFEAVVHPGSEGEYYAFPPNKSYVFSKPTAFKFKAQGFEPLLSFAQGGLAETWTGGVYPLNDLELKHFPFDYSDIEPYFNEIAKRIGITGCKDDLARFYPVHENLMEPLRLDEHSELLIKSYEKQKSYLNNNLRCYMGRARVATLNADYGDRKGCSYTGRCLWGCPSGAFYTPSLTLNECKSYSNFTYVPNMYVSHLKFDSNNNVKSVVAESLIDEGTHEITADTFVLGAGTLSSSKIFMDSVLKKTGEVLTLSGLMDNRQILIPFINLNMIGKKYDPETYQYHQLAMGIEGEASGEYFHALITTLKTALVHPIIQNVALDLRTSLRIFRNVRAGLGIVNLNFADSRRNSSYLTLQKDEQSGRSRLFISYTPIANEKAVMDGAVRTVTKSLRKLGCIVPPGMKHIRPMGASVHYAGTIPMSMSSKPLTTSPYCKSHDFKNLYFVDGTTFPALPAKNLTFSLMANAARVADQAF
jgi:choline dehydrogenase-like flavoprotein